jgi:hypothetical protein
MPRSLVSQAGPQAMRRVLAADATYLKRSLTFPMSEKKNARMRGERASVISSRFRFCVEVELPRWRCPGGGVEIEVSNFVVVKSRNSGVHIRVSERSSFVDFLVAME